MSVNNDNSTVNCSHTTCYRNLSDNTNWLSYLALNKTQKPQFNVSEIITTFRSLFRFWNKLHFSGPSSPIWRNLARLVWESVGDMVARGSAKVRRILAYLFDSEAREVNPWLRDDIRVAAKTLKYAFEGESDPFRLAFVSYFGTHPEKAVPYWQERAAKTEAWGNPKKPVQAVEVEQAKKAGAQ